VADVLVVGAGVAGLVGARLLELAGHRVTVVDKGRRPGGRMATRRVGEAVFDHGAQFVTLREPELAAETARWRERGWLVEWFRGAPDLGAGSHAPPAADDGGHPRFRGAPYQRALPEALAAELADVRCSVHLEALAHDGDRWRASGRTHDGEALALAADALLCTPPAPQALALLAAGDTRLPSGVDAMLRAVTFDPCLAVLAVPRGPVALPSPGAVRLPDHPVLDFVADNHAKGVSPVPSVTVHASAAYSRAHLDGDRAAAAREVLDAAEELLGCAADVVHVHGWRYSAPSSSCDDRAPGGTLPGPVRFAGDAFTGGRAEGAALSGHVAATRLLDALA